MQEVAGTQVDRVTVVALSLPRLAGAKMSIYSEAQAIADSGARVLVMVSRGRDSLCMVKTLIDHVHPDNLVFLHLRTYETVGYINRHLQKIQDFFEIPLEIQPSRQARKMSGGKLGDFAKERNQWREHYNCDLVAYGFRSDESVSRSVIMRQWPTGINTKSQECYPLKRWNRAIVAQYAKKHRFPMAEEYEYGFRDVAEQFVNDAAVWLHDTHPEDFQAACLEDPNLAAEYVRHTGNPL